MHGHRLARLRLTTFCLALAVARPVAAGAQVVVVDEGTFTLTIGGERVGREDFSIRRSPAAANAVLVAQGNVLLGDLRLAVALNTDSLGVPLRFQEESFLLDRSSGSVTGEWRRGLWSALAVEQDGESAREFRLPAGSVAFADGVVHQLWFLLRFRPGVDATQLEPSSMTLRPVHAEDAGQDVVTIGLREVEAKKWVVRALADGHVIREAWTDTAGRLLRVRIPDQDMEALRDEAPAETP